MAEIDWNFWLGNIFWLKNLFDWENIFFIRSSGIGDWWLKKYFWGWIPTWKFLDERIFFIRILRGCCDWLKNIFIAYRLFIEPARESGKLIIKGKCYFKSACTCWNPVSTVHPDTGFHGYPIRYPWKQIHPPGRRRNLAQVSTSTFVVDSGEQVSTCTGCPLAGTRGNIFAGFHGYQVDRFPR